jgi:hypothetical protein
LIVRFEQLTDARAEAAATEMEPEPPVALIASPDAVDATTPVT